MSQFGTFVVTAILLTSISAMAEDDCIRHQSQLDSYPGIKSTVDKMGGMEDLQGVWDLNIMFTQKQIVFQNRPDGLKASVNGSEFSSIMICDSPNNGALEVRILDKSGKDTKQNVYVKPGRKGSMQVAAEESQWKYYSFAKSERAQDGRVPSSMLSGKK